MKERSVDEDKHLNEPMMVTTDNNQVQDNTFLKRGFFGRMKESLMGRATNKLSEDELMQLVDEQQNDKIDHNKFVLARKYCFYISCCNFLF